MLKIQTSPLSKMLGYEHFQYHTENKFLIEKSGANALGIAPQFGSYLTSYNQLDVATKKIVKSDHTEQISVGDAGRDNMLRAIEESCKTGLRHFSEEIVASAKRLNTLLNTYGNIPKLPLSQQTAATFNLLQEFRGKYKSDVAILRIKDLVDELERLNRLVEDLMRERYEETNEKSGVGLKASRVQIDGDYNTIVTRINAAIVMEGAAAYEEYVNALNIVIDRYKADIKRRLGVAKARKEREK